MFRGLNFLSDDVRGSMRKDRWQEEQDQQNDDRVLLPVIVLERWIVGAKDEKRHFGKGPSRRSIRM
jgi:hypothetical protein